MTDEVPKTQNWVKARAECSIGQLFILLEAVLEFDAKAATERGRSGYLTFSVNRPTEDLLVVVRGRKIGGFIESDSVGFKRLPDGSMSVSRRNTKDETPLFVAKPHLDIKGDCKFEVDGTPLELWQVSKRALEKLFFEHGLSATPET